MMNFVVEMARKHVAGHAVVRRAKSSGLGIDCLTCRHTLLASPCGVMIISKTPGASNQGALRHDLQLQWGKPAETPADRTPRFRQYVLRTNRPTSESTTNVLSCVMLIGFKSYWILCIGVSPWNYDI